VAPEPPRGRPRLRLGAALGGRARLVPGVGQDEHRGWLERGVARRRAMLPERAHDLEVPVTGEAWLDPPVLTDAETSERGGDGTVRQLRAPRAHPRFELG